MSNLAAIDLGTNTFHILIAEQMDSYPFFKPVFKKRVYVYLGKGGVQTILEENYQLGIETLIQFKELARHHQVEQCKVVGTEALRIAENGVQFTNEVKEKTGLDIEVIGGLREAELIYKGVRAYLSDFSKPSVIMDIGGGSVEFIIMDSTGILWRDSLPIGISVLYSRFQKNDPLLGTELEEATNFILSKVDTLKEQIEKFNVKRLIGSAGSFEVVSSMLDAKSLAHIEMNPSDILGLYDAIINLDFEQRKLVPGIPVPRVKLMPIALHLLVTVLKALEIEEVVYCDYALKEGVISELIEK